MTFTFVCQNCDDSFELDYDALSSARKGLKCEGCGKRLPPADLEEFVTSLDEVLGLVADLRKRFVVSFDVDAEDLPAAFEGGSRRGGDDDDDEEESDGDADDEVEEDDEDDDRY